LGGLFRIGFPRREDRSISHCRKNEWLRSTHRLRHLQACGSWPWRETMVEYGILELLPTSTDALERRRGRTPESAPTPFGDGDRQEGRNEHCTNEQ
jgi:hypothetical protein